MNKTLTIVIVLIIIVVGSYFIFFNKPAQTNQPIAPTTTTEQSPSSGTTNTEAPAVETQPVTPAPVVSTVSVDIKGFAFNPQILTIKAGTKVTWTNSDSAPHTVTSDTGNLLHSSTIAPGQSFSFTFTTAGTVQYHCSIHPMMKGSVVVK